MSRHLSMTRFAALTCGLAAVLVATAPAFARADDASDLNDAGAKGFIGLCDAGGHPITSGSINDTPFVARATGSEPTPRDYREDGQRATLLAYQPRPGVPAGAWSGEILTGSTIYTDWHYPTALATATDFSLAQVMADIPPQVNGLYELRLIYSGPNRPPGGGGYAATFIKVTGDTWSVLKGGTASCTGGKAVSTETLAQQAAPTLVPAYINGRPNPAAFPHGTPTYQVPDSFFDKADGTLPETTVLPSGQTAPPRNPRFSASPTPSAAATSTASVTVADRTRRGAPVGLVVGLVAGVAALAFGAGALVRGRNGTGG